PTSWAISLSHSGPLSARAYRLCSSVLRFYSLRPTAPAFGASTACGKSRCCEVASRVTRKLLTSHDDRAGLFDSREIDSPVACAVPCAKLELCLHESADGEFGRREGLCLAGEQKWSIWRQII